nr:MAG TPA: S1 domain [Caudoviricetes sp.]
MRWLWKRSNRHRSISPRYGLEGLLYETKFKSMEWTGVEQLGDG